MTWSTPILLTMVPTSDSMSFQTMPPGCTGLPIDQHCGAFGVQRKHHTHEGVDLYAPVGMPVLAVEPGQVVAVKPFTGPHAGPSLAHWLDTWAVFVEGESGVVVYGEIAPHVKVGATVHAGQVVGVVMRVLRNYKHRPVSMLHLELHKHGSRNAPEWLVHDNKPDVLLDPTPYLLAAKQIIVV